MTEPAIAADADAPSDPAADDADLRAEDGLEHQPRTWAVAWVATLALAALFLLMGDPGRTPWLAVGALGLGALAVLGGLWSIGVIGAPAPAPSEAIPFQAVAPAPAPAEPSDAAHELARFETLMGDLPELALLLDDHDRAEVVFGRPIPGLTSQALHEGLAALVDPLDREALRAHLAEARGGAHVQGVVRLAPGAGPDRLRYSARATSAGGLALILQEPAAEAAPVSTPVSAPVPVPLPAAAPEPDPELAAVRAALAAAREEREAALAESASKSRFLANMSHELRTPLNAILGFSDIMRTRLFGPLSDRYAEYAELIHESGRHLTDLINDILDMSKIDADRYVLQREVFDAREPLEAAIKLMGLQAQDKGVDLRADLGAAPLVVDADRRALKQIAINLLSNALKFTPGGGRVDASLHAASGALELVVADTGVGIAPEDLARLGRPFEQTDAGRRMEGTGLGLALVKALAGLHGGDLALESRQGEGTAATVRLPVLKTEAAAPAANDAAAASET